MNRSTSSAEIISNSSNINDLENARFLLKAALDSLSVAIENLNSPVSVIPEASLRYLTSQQRTVIENAFLARTTSLKSNLAEVRRQFESSTTNEESLRRLQRKHQDLRDHYMRSEQVFDYYVDLLHTRSEHGMGSILSGCDSLCYASLSQGLKPLGIENPVVFCYADPGIGAAILKSGIPLGDRQTNPAANIKIVRSSLPLPRLTSILHECGHQAAHMTNWNAELAQLLHSTIIGTGGARYLADLWSSWASEIAADFWSLHQSNFSALMTLYEVLTGSSERVFSVIPGDPHPMPLLRVYMAAAFCRMAFGNGPWDDFERVWRILYPINESRAESAKIVEESLPLLPTICKAISTTKMNAFLGNGLNQILSWNFTSPSRIREFLNHDLSSFSVTEENRMEFPILTLTSFRIIQMFGGRSHEWIIENMRNWLKTLSVVRGAR